jgi:hypothetical protein
MIENTKSEKVLIDLQYLPCIEYYAVLLHAGEVIIEENENFVKQTYRNRCNILTANGIDILTVPVIGGNKKIRIKDIKIDYNQKWVNRHWRAIASAYGKAPFFEYYSDYFHRIFSKKIGFLFDFNYELLKLTLKILQFNFDLKFSPQYVSDPGPEINDLRSVIHPKRTKGNFNKYTPVGYSQVFGSNFVDNLSIIDLIFNEGTNASEIIKLSYK